MCLLTFKHHGKGRYIVKSKAFYIHGFEAILLTVKAAEVHRGNFVPFFEDVYSSLFLTFYFLLNLQIRKRGEMFS